MYCIYPAYTLKNFRILQAQQLTAIYSHDIGLRIPGIFKLHSKLLNFNRMSVVRVTL